MALFYRVSSGSGKGGESGQGGRARGVGSGGWPVKEVGLVGSGQGVGSGGTLHLIELYRVRELGHGGGGGGGREKEEEI